MKLVSSRLWVATTAATPRWRARSCRLWNTASEVVGSRLPVGSSQSSRRGLLASARATATRCCSPPESCAGWWVRRSARPRSVSSVLRARLGLAPRLAGDHQRQGDVVERRQLRQQMVELVDEADVRAGGCGCGRGRRAVEQSSPSMTMVPAVGCSSRPAACSSDDLPEPDGPISPTSSPGKHLQVGALQHLQGALAGDVGARSGPG